MTEELQAILRAIDRLTDLLPKIKSEDTALELANIIAELKQFERPEIPPTDTDYVTGGTGVVNE